MESKEMEKNLEIIDVPTNKGEIVVEANNQVVEYNFQRVDLSDPKSILSYGQNVQDGIIAILQSTAQMSVNQEENLIDEDMLKKITSFDKALEDADKEAAKKEGVIKKITKFIALKTGSKNAQREEEMKTYKGRYNDYVENIRKIVDHIEVLKQNALNDIDLRSEIALQMRPLIAELEAMVNAGKEDKLEYDRETKEIEDHDTSLDGQFLVQRRSQISDIFSEKLSNLEKAVIVYKGQLQEYAIQQKNDMTVVMKADSYQRDQAPLLEVQGSVQVFNKIQEGRITTLQALNEASNIAIQNNARTLKTNTEEAVDLMINGGFTMETLQVVEKSLQEGISIIEKGKEQLKQKVEKDRKALEEINHLFDENERRIVAMIEETATALTDANNTTGYSRNRSITTNKPNGRR